MGSEDPSRDYLGLAGYTIVLLGVVSGGLWLVLLATSKTVSATVPGILAVVLLICGAVMVIYPRYPGHQDPLEPTRGDADTIADEDSEPGRTVRKRDT